MTQTSQARTGRIWAAACLVAGIGGFVATALMPGVADDRLAGLFSGLAGGGLVTLGFTLRPSRTRLSPVEKDRIETTAPWLYLVACLGLVWVLGALVLNEFWPGAVPLPLLAAGAAPLVIAAVPLIQQGRLAMADPSLNDERKLADMARSYQAGFNAMFIACMIGGACVVVTDWNPSATFVFYAIALFGALAQMVRLAWDAWPDRAAADTE